MIGLPFNEPMTLQFGGKQNKGAKKGKKKTRGGKSRTARYHKKSKRKRKHH